MLRFPGGPGVAAVDRQFDLATDLFAVSLRVVVGRRGDPDRAALALVGAAAAEPAGGDQLHD